MLVTVRKGGSMLDRARRCAWPARAWLAAALLLAGPALAASALADSLHVTRDAASGGSRFGLRLDVGDDVAGSAAGAFVAVGPEAGLRRETALAARFTLDVRRLRLAAPDGRAGSLDFLRFGEGAVDDTRLVAFVEQDAAGRWYLGARTWEDGAARYALAGRAQLAFEPDAGAPADRAEHAREQPVHVEIQWIAADSAASRGQLRVLLVDPPDGTESPCESVVLFENDALDNGRQTVSYVQVGVTGGARQRGAAGRLSIDAFDVARLAPAP